MHWKYRQQMCFFAVCFGWFPLDSWEGVYVTKDKHVMHFVWCKQWKGPLIFNLINCSYIIDLGVIFGGSKIDLFWKYDISQLTTVYAQKLNEHLI